MLYIYHLQLVAMGSNPLQLKFKALPWGYETYECVTLVNKGRSTIPVRLIISSVCSLCYNMTHYFLVYYMYLAQYINVITKPVACIVQYACSLFKFLFESCLVTIKHLGLYSLIVQLSQ